MTSTSHKTALVLAASSGIGAASARALAGRGYRVAVLARSSAVDGVAAGIGGLALRGDYTEAGVIEEAVAQVGEQWGRIDVLVNGAGHGPKGTMTELTSDDFAAGFDLYFHHAVRASQAVAPVMEAQGGGAIVNISSASPSEPSSRFPTSMVARAALATWVKLWSAEVAPRGIRINNVLPGYTVADPSTVPAEWVASIPMGRPASYDEVGEVVAFLASEQSAYMTGQSVRVDGGFTRSV